MDGWQALHLDELKAARAQIGDWLLKGQFLSFDAAFYMPWGNVFTKKNVPKRMDVSNRIKALHDVLSKKLGFDDKHIFEMRAFKRAIVSNNARDAFVDLEIGCVHRVNAV